MSEGEVRRAVTMILAAMAILGLIDNLVVSIAAEGGLWQFHTMRAAMALPALWAIARWRGQSLRPRNWRRMWLRSLTLGSAMILYFGALGFLPIAQVAAGLFSSPIFVLILSVAVFGVRIGPWRVVAVAAGFAGILLILKPGGADASVAGLIPVAAGALYALSAILTRRWCMQESTLTLLFGFFAVLGGYGVLGSVGVALLSPTASGFVTTPWVWPSAAFLWLTAVQAVGSLVAIGLVTQAYQRAEASYVAVFEYTFLIFAGVFAYLLYGDVPDRASVAGIFLIVGAGIMISFRSPKPT